MYCTNCGTEIKDSATFCKNCGVSTDNSPESNHQNNLSGAADVQVKKPKRKIIISAIIAVVLIVIFAVVLLIKSPMTKEEAMQTTAENYFIAVGSSNFSMLCDTVFPENIEKEMIRKYGHQMPEHMNSSSKTARTLHSLKILKTTPLNPSEIQDIETRTIRYYKQVMKEDVNKTINISEAYGLNVEVSFQADGEKSINTQETICVVYKVGNDWCCNVF